MSRGTFNSLLLQLIVYTCFASLIVVCFENKFFFCFCYCCYCFVLCVHVYVVHLCVCSSSVVVLDRPPNNTTNSCGGGDQLLTIMHTLYCNSDMILCVMVCTLYYNYLHNCLFSAFWSCHQIKPPSVSIIYTKKNHLPLQTRSTLIRMCN